MQPLPHTRSDTSGRSGGGARAGLGGFALRCLVAIALIVGALLLWQLQQVMLLLFAAILVAVILKAAAGGLQRLAPLGDTPALLLAAVLILALLGGIGLLFGREMAAQFDALGQTLPGAWDNFVEQVGADRVRALMERFAPEGSTVAGIVQTVLGVVTGALTGLVLAILGGLYLALNPESYRRGMIRLFPNAARARVGRAADATGHSLKAWLVGQLVSMLVVGLLTWGGLTLIGVPSAVALGLIAALLEFVPLVGPIVAAVPGVLIALTMGFESFALVAGLYLLIQQLEGNVLSPVIMRHSVSIPPAVTLFSIFLFGALFGAMGVILGGPLTVAAFVLVRELWLDEDVRAADADD